MGDPGWAARKTMRHRKAIACGVDRARTSEVSVSRCPGDSGTAEANGRGIGGILAASERDTHYLSLILKSMSSPLAANL